MSKKLYYVVEKELQDIDRIEEATGHKDITVYEITDNVPYKFFGANIPNEESTEEYIKGYLDDNGHGDEEFELIQL